MKAELWDKTLGSLELINGGKLECIEGQVNGAILVYCVLILMAKVTPSTPLREAVLAVLRHDETDDLDNILSKSFVKCMEEMRNGKVSQ